MNVFHILSEILQIFWLVFSDGEGGDTLPIFEIFKKTNNN